MCLLVQVEEVLPGELGFLRACDGHDDLHDLYGPQDERYTPSQRYHRGPQPLPLHHVLGEAGAPRPFHHEPPLLSVLCTCTGE